MKLRRMKSFGEDVDRLQFTENIASRKRNQCKMQPNITTLNFNVFGMFMENRIINNMYSSLIVTIEKNKMRHENTKIKQKLVKPLEFRNC